MTTKAKDGRETLQERFDLEKARAVLARTRAAGGSYSPDAVAKLLNALDAAQAEIARLNEYLDGTIKRHADELKVFYEENRKYRDAVLEHAASLLDEKAEEYSDGDPWESGFTRCAEKSADQIRALKRASLLRQPETITVRGEPRPISEFDK